MATFFFSTGVACCISIFFERTSENKRCILLRGFERS
jgi:hypothetical protein